MVKNFITVKVSASDHKRLMTEGKALMIKNHPFLKGMHLSQPFMYSQAADILIHMLKMGFKNDALNESAK